MAKKKRPAAVKVSRQASAARTVPSAKGEKRMYSLEVSLIGGLVTSDFADKNPTVSRTIQIRGDQTLESLHYAIFAAFDRYDEHMYEFQFGKRPMAPGPRYMIPCDSDFALEMSDDVVGFAHEATIDSLGVKTRQKFFYWFDFGDDWWHEIKVAAVEEGTFAGEPKVIKRVGESPPQYMDFEDDEEAEDDDDDE
jgi:hypothetical protein